MFTITGDLEATETVETFLQRWFTMKPWCVTVIEVVRYQEDIPRQDVAYVLREQRQQGMKNADDAKEVLVVFLKDYDHRLEGYVCQEQEMPLAFDCPSSILEQLPPSTNQSVLTWRKQCWLRHEHPLVDGDIITFDVTIPTPSIPAGAPLTVELKDSTPVFINEQGQHYHVPYWRMYPFSFLPIV